MVAVPTIVGHRPLLPPGLRAPIGGPGDQHGGYSRTEVTNGSSPLPSNDPKGMCKTPLPGPAGHFAQTVWPGERLMEHNLRFIGGQVRRQPLMSHKRELVTKKSSYMGRFAPM